MVLDFTMRFDDVLDPEKLCTALTRLMELGNWRKLGARLRMNVKDAPVLQWNDEQLLITNTGHGQAGISRSSAF